MKRMLAEQDLPGHDQLRPAAILGAIARAKKNERWPTAKHGPNAVEPTTTVRAARRALRGATARGGRAGLRTTSCSRPWTCSSRRPRCWNCQGRWLYLHVDGLQDTNRPQYLWVRALAAAGKESCLRRGRRRPEHLCTGKARDVQNILDFDADYPMRRS